jgi:hypothetical protein
VTGIDRREAVPWDRPAWLEIGQALLAAGVRMTAGEIAAAIGEGKDQSNVKRTAEEMTTAELLTRAHPSRAGHGPGRPATADYGFAEGKAGELESYLVARTHPGLLRPAQQLVFADARAPGLEDVFHVITEFESAGRASWAALCDGDPQEYVFVFESDEA